MRTGAFLGLGETRTCLLAKSKGTSIEINERENL